MIARARDHPDIVFDQNDADLLSLDDIAENSDD